MRLVQRSVAGDDPDPGKAISCYGLSFVNGRPLSTKAARFLERSREKLGAAGKKVLLLIRDNASWHTSREVRRWRGSHNRRVKKGGRG